LKFRDLRLRGDYENSASIKLSIKLPLFRPAGGLDHGNFVVIQVDHPVGFVAAGFILIGPLLLVGDPAVLQDMSRETLLTGDHLSLDRCGDLNLQPALPADVVEVGIIARQGIASRLVLEPLPSDTLTITSCASVTVRQICSI
jgi:hypothetical protein